MKVFQAATVINPGCIILCWRNYYPWGRYMSDMQVYNVDDLSLNQLNGLNLYMSNRLAIPFVPWN